MSDISDEDWDAACDAFSPGWRTYGSFDRFSFRTKMRAAIEALQALGWRKVEEVKPQFDYLRDKAPNR